MSVLEYIGLIVAVLLMGYLARNILELERGARRLPPCKPAEPRTLPDPITMSWDDPERRDSK